MIVKIIKVVVVCATVVFLVASLSRLEVSGITCKSQLGDCSEELKSDISSIGNPAVFFVGRAIKQKLANNVRVEKYSLEFTPPLKVIVNVVENKPFFKLAIVDTNKKYLLDKNGIVLTENDLLLPRVTVNSGDFNVGQKVPSGTLFALEIVGSIYRSFIPKESILKNNNLEVIMKDDVVAIFPLTGDREYLVGSFVLIYSQLNKEGNEFKIDGSRVKTIDLRFRNPILK